MKNRTRESCTSGSVRDEDGNILIYSARHDEAIDALMRPATEKRQGRKSRSVVLRRRGGVYGDLAAEPEVPLGLERLRRWICRKVWVGVSVGTSGRHVAREDL